MESDEVWDMFPDAPEPEFETDWGSATDGVEPESAVCRIAAVEARLAALQSATWVDQLERVSTLFERGLLSDEEFQQAKDRLLSANRE